MKFESLTMLNFMRYEGVNRIDFSCDPDKNVTIVLGDNTVGKTTIAQAFRWCLYGKLLSENDKKDTDFHLLNNDVADRLTNDTKGTVSVETVILTNDTRYTIKRDITYRHCRNDYGLEEVSKHVSMTMGKKNTNKASIEVETAKIRDIVNELLPENLSSYFLFDGERWNDISVSGVKNDIKDSVHILTGVSSMQNAMKHLKDMGSQSVVSKFKSNIRGTGNVYTDLKRREDTLEQEIGRNEEDIKHNQETVNDMKEKINSINQWLSENKNTEELQKEYRCKKSVQESAREQLKKCHSDLVTDFSDKAYEPLAEPMVNKALELIKKADLKKGYIPAANKTLIDFILRRGKCICGTCIADGSEEYEALIEQMEYLEKTGVGGNQDAFEKMAERWKNVSNGNKQIIEKDVILAEEADRKYRENVSTLDGLSEKIKKNVDFSSKRSEQSKYQNILVEKSANIGEEKNIIENKRQEIRSIENSMQEYIAKDKENLKWQRRYKIASELYDECRRRYELQEKKVFSELNAGIEKNFDRMFHEKDKRIELDNDYNIRMLYRSGGAFSEEKNLSEGEKVARNFAFIVTMMESGCRLQSENSGVDSEQLPIVLDGPFSKLGDENIALIASALPAAAEQVIIFMLDKDWKYTGLDDYVGSRYHIDKNPEDNFASISKVKGD